MISWFCYLSFQSQIQEIAVNSDKKNNFIAEFNHYHCIVSINEAYTNYKNVSFYKINK